MLIYSRCSVCGVFRCGSARIRYRSVDRLRIVDSLLVHPPLRNDKGSRCFVRNNGVYQVRRRRSYSSRVLWVQLRLMTEKLSLQNVFVNCCTTSVNTHDGCIGSYPPEIVVGVRATVGCVSNTSVLFRRTQSLCYLVTTSNSPLSKGLGS